MTLILVGCVVTFLLGFHGFIRGVWGVLAFLFALLVATALARPLAPLVAELCRNSGMVPASLVTAASIGFAGFTVFVVVASVSSWVLRRRRRARQMAGQPAQLPWERIAGAVLGACWGFALFVIVLTGLHFLASVETELQRSAPAPTPPRYAALKDQIDATPLLPLVRAVNPGEEKVSRIFGDLAVVASDEVLLDRFRNHPAIFPLTAHPALLAVTEDNRIRTLVEQQRYYQLLDDPKIVSLLGDEELVARCREIDLDVVLGEVLGRHASPPSPPPAASSH